MIKKNFVFKFKDLGLDLKKKYTGRIVKIDIAVDRYNVERFRVWVALDNMNSDNVFMYAMKITLVKPSSFYTFCEKMNLFQYACHTFNVREVLIDKAVSVSLMQCDDGSVFINKIEPIEEIEDYLRKRNCIYKHRKKTYEKLAYKEFEEDIDAEEDDCDDELGYEEDYEDEEDDCDDELGYEEDYEDEEDDCDESDYEEDYEDDYEEGDE